MKKKNYVSEILAPDTLESHGAELSILRNQAICLARTGHTLQVRNRGSGGWYDFGCVDCLFSYTVQPDISPLTKQEQKLVDIIKHPQ